MWKIVSEIHHQYLSKVSARKHVLYYNMFSGRDVDIMYAKLPAGLYAFTHFLLQSTIASVCLKTNLPE